MRDDERALRLPHSLAAKFIQIAALGNRDHSIVALDEEGHCWEYIWTEGMWSAIPAIRETP